MRGEQKKHRPDLMRTGPWLVPLDCLLHEHLESVHHNIVSQIDVAQCPCLQSLGELVILVFLYFVVGSVKKLNRAMIFDLAYMNSCGENKLFSSHAN